MIAPSLLARKIQKLMDLSLSLIKKHQRKINFDFKSQLRQSLFLFLLKKKLLSCGFFRTRLCEMIGRQKNKKDSI